MNASRHPSQRPTLPRIMLPNVSDSAGRPEASVLVVDADRVTQRLIEMTLSKAKLPALEFSVEVAQDAAGALDILSSSLVDLVIAETSLTDMSGMLFFRNLKLERRLRDVPFVFLSADRRVETRVGAIKAGADAYLMKPCEPAELVAYARALVARRRAALEERARRTYTLAGDLSALPFPDLVSILHLSRRCGVLSVITPRAAGEVYFNDGEVLHATYGSLGESTAFHRLVAAQAGSFEFATADPSTFPERTITESVTSLVMEGARLVDEAEHSRQLTGAARSVPPGRSQPAVSRVRASLVPTRALGIAFERAVSDPFVMGELRLYTPAELEASSREAGDEARLELYLIAELGDGVSTLLSAASQSTESLILSALSREPKLLGLSFHLRNERSLEVVLLDIDDLRSAEPLVAGSRAVVIVAPPQGDALALGPKGLVDLGRLFEQAQPSVVVGVGSKGLEEALAAIPSVKDARLPVRSVRGALGSASADLRPLLATAVRLWASSAPPQAGTGSQGLP